MSVLLLLPLLTGAEIWGTEIWEPLAAGAVLVLLSCCAHAGTGATSRSNPNPTNPNQTMLAILMITEH
jgi:hypothetical protein